MLLSNINSVFKLNYPPIFVSLSVVLLIVSKYVIASDASLTVITHNQLAYNEPTRSIKPHNHNQNKSINDLIAQIRDLSEFKKIVLINNYFNKFSNISDLKLWGHKEYWATPDELIKKNGGDCEDFAVAKYYYLTQIGINEGKLRLAYVKAYNRKISTIENHLVLLYYNISNQQEYVLDSIDRLVKPVSHRKDLSYQFAFNKNNVWPLNKSINAFQIRRSGIFQSWKGVLKRM